MTDAGPTVPGREPSSPGDGTGDGAPNSPDPLIAAERQLGALVDSREADGRVDIDQLRDTERALLAALGHVRKRKRRTGSR